MALLLAAHAWAQAHGRSLTALTVDHRMQPQSAAWTDACRALAARLGVGFQPLAWEGPKPERGLPAAARTARHRLLADATRALGARVLLVGHTADDVLEARAMRAEGSTTPAPREWTPSPVWPEGRGLFLLRPLLALRRADLRAWLGAQGASWIEDPANVDPTYARARARARLRGEGDLQSTPDEPLALAEVCASTADGGLSIARPALRAAPTGEVEQLLAMACVCAGGGSRPPSSEARARLAAALRSSDEVVATLAGARVEADADCVRMVREAGEARRGGLAPLQLAIGEIRVWDGRFEVTATSAGEVRALRGLARRLSPEQQRALAATPASARPALPVFVDEGGAVSCPLLGSSPLQASSLVEPRLRAAAGLIASEAEVGDW